MFSRKMNTLGELTEQGIEEVEKVVELLPDPDVLKPNVQTIANQTKADPAQIASLLAEQTFERTAQRAELIAEATGVKSELERMGIKLSLGQVKNVMAAVGLLASINFIKKRPPVMYGLLGYLAYINQERLFGNKII